FCGMGGGRPGGGGGGVPWARATTTASQNFVNGTGSSVFHIGDTVTFNDSNNGHYAVTISGTVSPMGMTVNNSVGNYVFAGSGSIIGTTGITKSGTGSLTLGTANTFTGG